MSTRQFLYLKTQKEQKIKELEKCLQNLQILKNEVEYLENQMSESILSAIKESCPMTEKIFLFKDLIENVKYYNSPYKCKIIKHEENSITVEYFHKQFEIYIDEEGNINNTTYNILNQSLLDIVYHYVYPELIKCI